MGADDTSIWTRTWISKRRYNDQLVHFEVNVMDWNLEHVNVLSFQDSDSKNGLYIADIDPGIVKICRKSSKLFVFIIGDETEIPTMNIYDERDGRIIKSIKIDLDEEVEPKFDSNHLLVMDEDRILSFYDLNGNLVKCVDMSKYKTDELFDYGIYQYDQIYAYDSKFLFSN